MPSPVTMLPSFCKCVVGCREREIDDGLETSLVNRTELALGRLASIANAVAEPGSCKSRIKMLANLSCA